MLEKIPLLNSPKKGIRILGYVIYGLLALMILGALSPAPSPSQDTTPSSDPAGEVKPTEEDCIDSAEFSIRVDDILMQTGYFKSVRTFAYEGDKIVMEVEPSSTAYSDPAMFKPILYGVVEAAPACLGIKNVEITVKLPDYNMVLRYPFSAALNHTEDTEGTSRIEQR